MLLIPYKEVVIHTPFTPRQAKTRLERHIGAPLQRPRTAFPARAPYRPPYPWEGVTTETGFRARRCIEGRNGFLPHLYGQIRQTPAGADVVVRMTLHPGVALALLAVVIFTVVALAWYIVNAGERNTLVGPARLVPPAVFAAGYVIVMARFAPEARLAEDWLRAIYAAP